MKTLEIIKPKDNQIPPNFIKTIILLAKKLKGYQYAIRGTSSLILQGIDMIALDIDILCDKRTALKCNAIFKDFLVEKVEYKTSEKYKSYLGKFKINNIEVEIMACWQIKLKDGTWSEVYDASSFNEIRLNGTKIKVTKIEDELKVFAQMGRWNAFHKIKREIFREEGQIPLLGKT